MREEKAGLADGQFQIPKLGTGGVARKVGGTQLRLEKSGKNTDRFIFVFLDKERELSVGFCKILAPQENFSMGEFEFLFLLDIVAAFFSRSTRTGCISCQRPLLAIPLNSSGRSLLLPAARGGSRAIRGNGGRV